MDDAKAIFLDALDLEPAEREAFLAEQCGADPELRADVDRLLGAHGQSNGVFGIDEALVPDAVRSGARIGSYLLVDEIGQGGFAVVWSAQQIEPVSRSVALKVLKPGMDTREVVSRFELERQALALMDHPFIAKVFDGGATSAGRPWFAMELVDGIPITDYCEEQGLGKRARLELFLHVCKAVQHAHQKGVIHRDLKPSNVLVGNVDGKAAPKVIDFGIAKAVERKLTEDSIQTVHGQIIGTPAYMSPEQVNGSKDLDTRCDVYALGVLLYELLSGARPFEDETLQALGLAEVLRVIQEVEPPRPSTRQGTKLDTAGHVKSRELRGDLDWIVMRCLEKNRERRYGSAGMLAHEIERHLAGDPVLAGPPNLGYRVRKFTRRHRIALGVSATFIGMLIAGVVVSVVLMLRAHRAERELADESVRTSHELAKFRSISAFLEAALMTVDPSVAQGEDTKLMRNVLDRAAQRVGNDFEEVPEVEASIRRVIGNAYRTVARPGEAEDQLRRSLELWEGLGETDALTLAEVQLELGTLLLSERRDDEAEPLLLTALELRRDRLGDNDPLVHQALSSVAILHDHRGEFEEAESMLRALEAARIELYGERHPATIRTVNNLAGVLEHLGRFDEAIERYRHAVELQREVQGDRHPETLKAITNLGSRLLESGRVAAAMPHLRAALEIKREVLADGDRSLLVGINSLARLHRQLGNFDEAEALFAEGCEMLVRTNTEETEGGVILRFNYAGLLRWVGRGQEAEAVCARASEAARGAFGEDHALTVMVESLFAWEQHLNGNSEAAEPLSRAVAERARAQLSEDDPTLPVHEIRSGLIALGAGERERGVAALQAALERKRTPRNAEWFQRGARAVSDAAAARER